MLSCGGLVKKEEEEGEEEIPFRPSVRPLVPVAPIIPSKEDGDDFPQKRGERGKAEEALGTTWSGGISVAVLLTPFSRCTTVLCRASENWSRRRERRRNTMPHFSVSLFCTVLCTVQRNNNATKPRFHPPFLVHSNSIAATPLPPPPPLPPSKTFPPSPTPRRQIHSKEISAGTQREEGERSVTSAATSRRFVEIAGTEEVFV